MSNSSSNQTSKILGIELLKFIAAIMITNSHFKALYIAPFSAFGTFGAPGNALFFFISGYTLALSCRSENFVNWYKRRIGRIYPSLLSWTTFIGPILFGISITWDSIWLGEKYWFIKCIFIYYFLLHFIIKYFSHRLKLIFSFSLLLSIVFYLLMPVTKMSIYSVSFHYVSFFSIMLMGVFLAKNREIIRSKNIKIEMFLCFISFIVFYALQYWGKGKNGLPYYSQILSLIPLHTFIYYLYLLITNSWAEKIIKTKYLGTIISIVATLTLEIYLVGYVLGITSLNFLFPLNLLIVFGFIVSVAFLVKMFSNLVLQIFSNEPMNLVKLVKII